MTLPQVAAEFLLAAALMTGVALAFVLPAMLRRPSMRRQPTPGTINAAIYRAQLAELDAAFTSGNLGAADYRVSTDDIMRRVPQDVVEDPARPDRPRRAWHALIVAFALPALATTLYLAVGHPPSLTPQDTMDAPTSPAQLTRAELPQFMERLETHLARAPADGRGWVLLARANFEMDRFAAAAQAYERALAVSRKVAGDPRIWCELADALGMTQGGSLKGRPRELIGKALALNPRHPQALEMAGSAEYEAGDFKRALGYWETLLAAIPPESQGRRELEIAIARTRGIAGDSPP
jgi:cytochrome c-type biogenesis protein CcmH